jgi:hypothetical protein
VTNILEASDTLEFSMHNSRTGELT